ncbi:MAG: twin-arginine translocase TatA/TatE family subunit [bacterium]
MPNIGMPELIIILVIVLLIFGANKIPEIAKGLGRGIRDFRKAMDEGDPSLEDKRKDKPEKSER